MYNIKEKNVNRKQFHYLICKFLLEKGLAKKFYDYSMRYKLKTIEQGKDYFGIYVKYEFQKPHSFSEHMYKCIDIYTNENNPIGRKYIDTYYNGFIHGFFRLIPATFEEDYGSFWKKVEDEWEKLTRGIKFDDGNN